MPEKLKRPLRKILLNPYGLRLGAGSRVFRPYTIYGKRYIRVGDRSVILRDAYLSAVTDYAGVQYHPEIIIGDDVYVGRYVYLTAINRIVIESGCVLSEHVYITDLFHGAHPDRGLIMKQELESKGPVHIGPNCFLGYRVSVMPGVVLGNNCVVGTNSVVTRSFPPYSMIAGAPARVIKVYSPEHTSWVRSELAGRME